MRWEDIHERAGRIVGFLVKKERAGKMAGGKSSDNGKSVSNVDIEYAAKFRDSGVLFENLTQREQFDYQRAYLRLRRRNRVRKTLRYSAAAAAAVIFIGGAIFTGYEYLWNGSDSDTLVSDYSNIKPIEKKARLILADGMEVDIKAVGEAVVEQNGKKIVIGAQGVNYEVDSKRSSLPMESVRGIESSPKKNIYNSLEIPRGGEYSLTLADGTKVWMNADSKLRYPISFVEDKRVVYLEGEAYFEVAKDASKPFIVSTASGEITVLGTQFNVKSYKEENSIYTTLVEGSVSFRGRTNKETILSPGYQLIYNQEQGTQELKRVNVGNFISWKDNLFQFEELSLEDIMKTLARWYDVTVTYEKEELKQLQFSGNLDKYSNIESFFKLFEVGAKIEFKVVNRHVHVKTKKLES
ncbi:MAG: FecR family protein [Bacteroidales bacterium]